MMKKMEKKKNLCHLQRLIASTGKGHDRNRQAQRNPRTSRTLEEKEICIAQWTPKSNTLGSRLFVSDNSLIFGQGVESPSRTLPEIRYLA